MSIAMLAFNHWSIGKVLDFKMCKAKVERVNFVQWNEMERLQR